jgi:hypothetical protein
LNEEPAAPVAPPTQPIFVVPSFLMVVALGWAYVRYGGYERIVKTRPRILVGTSGEQIVQELGRIPPLQFTFLRSYVEAAR